MSHDIEASWASTEIAKILAGNPAQCFSSAPSPSDVSTYAGREGKTNWPHADGVIELLDDGSTTTYNIAVEYKRPNEGVHGVLTALGQSHAYLQKGYAGSAIIVPRQYPGLSDTGSYIKDVLDNTSKADSIGVFVYDTPDRSKVSPFEGKIEIARSFLLDASTGNSSTTTLGKPETQWVHVREGSSEPDAYFRYLQAVKLVSGDDYVEPPFAPPTELLDAVDRLSIEEDPNLYLSYSSGISMHDRAWRYFWFKNILSKQMMIGWDKNSSGSFSVNHAVSNILRADGKGYKKWFSGKSNSKKNTLVDQLNAGKITEDNAWDKLAENFHDRAHSYREDIDSGLEGISFIDHNGRMTESGYRFLDACEKSSNPNVGAPKSLLARALLDEGGLAVFLHYVYKLSDEIFFSDPFRFSEENPNTGSFKFQIAKYLTCIEDKMSNDLHVLRKVTARGGTARQPFQAELALLRGMGLVSPNYRIGVGLPINWPEIQKVLEK